MPVYKYVGRDVLNRRRRGSVEAENPELAKEILFARGVVVVEKLSEDKSILSQNISLSFLERVTIKDLLIFTRQLHAMIHAGIPLVQALRIIKEQLPNRRLRQIVEEIASFIEEGGKFSTAISRYRDIFGDLYISMVRAAEEAGTLEETLKRLADYLEKVEKLRGKVKSALFYPVFVFIVAMLIVTGILVFVIPTFEQLYADMGGELPALTQMVIKVSNWVRDYAGWIVLFIVVFIIGFVQLRRLEKFRYLTDLLLLKLPIFGELVLKSSIASFARTLASMIASGINILNALSISAETANNEVIRKAIEDVRSQVEKGVSLSQALAKHSIFPPMLVNMVAIGEQAGNLDEMLSKVADFYEEEVDRTVDGLTSLIEPLMIVFIGSIIGVIIVALYLPIFNIASLIK
ncbi:type II secretion system F family protein [Thermovibrio ammonificans]|uniref:Type II secretion system F domain protein n=1 Tax=Thermovibrio ammonificans (strain DSM 15698 / JCM 12110 / HB-1) TaxID=648996 RepID=E8T263_THEA1|nr:type II secretion system F family protein [Thermovibrio ammonificans]ADU96958.1 Type II secretion system F domain protein [Thermovibrio ammonificans HB-1]